MDFLTTKLADLFSCFPGIGQRQAKRFVYFLLSQNPAFIKELSDAILDLKKNTRACDFCLRYYFEKLAVSNNFCPICRDKNREKVLMIVSKDLDIESIEKSGVFKGRYFVLGGTVPILEQEPEKKIRLAALLERVEKLSKASKLEEIIFAMDFNPEGENTADFVRKNLEPLAKKFNFNILSLGKGLSLGTELEYSDPETIKSALKNRV